jgi:hypothetical protein
VSNLLFSLVVTIMDRLDGKHRMSRSYYRWVIVAAGGLLGCVAIGAMFSLPVFLRPISRDTGWSITGVSSAMTFGFLAMALGSIIWGNLSDRFGPRLIVLIGSTGLAIALALASRATSLIEFQLIFGLAVGGATAAIFAPMMALRDRLVRHTSQPSCVSRFRRHGNGANDHVPIGGAAHFQPRLENVAPNPRRTRRSRYDSSSVAGASPASMTSVILGSGRETGR